MTGKPTIADLGLNPDTQPWQRSGEGVGAIEVAFVQAPAHSPDPDDTDPDDTDSDDTDSDSTDLAEWVLIRVADDPDARVLVFDRHEWECLLDGAQKGEFDDAARPTAP